MEFIRVNCREMHVALSNLRIALKWDLNDELFHKIAGGMKALKFLIPVSNVKCVEVPFEKCEMLSTINKKCHKKEEEGRNAIFNWMKYRILKME